MESCQDYLLTAPGRRATVILLLLLPLVVGMAWGLYLNDSAYITFHFVDQLLDGSYPASFPGGGSLFYSGLLLLFGHLGFSVPHSAVILSSIGWSITVITIYDMLRHYARFQLPVALLLALLLVLSPVVYSTSGTGVSWTLAGGTLSLLASARKRWPLQVAALLILLLGDSPWSALVLTLILLRYRWTRAWTFTHWRVFIFLLVTASCSALASGRFSPSIDARFLALSDWRWNLERLTHESELYWLVIPLAGVGLLTRASRRPWLWAWVGWGITAWLFADSAAWAILLFLILILAASGTNSLILRLQRRKWTHLGPRVLAVGGALVLGLPLIFAESTSLCQCYQMRPRAYQNLESVAVAWLDEYSEPDQLLLSSARVAYLADRPFLPWIGGREDGQDIPNLVASLVQAPPDYVVSVRTVAWDQLTRVSWFRERYQVAKSFSSAHVPTSPLVVWERRSTPYELGDRQSIYVETPTGSDLVAYQIWPWDIQGGDSVYVSLYWQATRPITEAFHTVLRVVSPLDEIAWGQQDLITPRSVPAPWWQPGLVIAERFELSTSPDMPPGAFQINFSLRSPRSMDLLPLHQDQDPNPLDQVLLDYISVPSPEFTPPPAATLVGAIFGDQIVLESVGLDGEFVQGGTLDVTLYWEALRPLDTDYSIFVHLVNEQDMMFSSHDGRPMMGRYTTLAWRPGHVVPDEHPIALPADLPGGDYHLRIGLYLPDTGTRLPAYDSQGQELPGDFVTLSIE